MILFTREALVTSIKQAWW